MPVTSGTRKKSIHGASSGASMGPGWGGPAKGAHPSTPKVPNWTSETAPRSGVKPEGMTDEQYKEKKSKIMARHKRAAALEDALFDIAMDEDLPPATRILAIDKSLDRIKGKPIPMSDNADKDNVIKVVGGLPDQIS